MTELAEVGQTSLLQVRQVRRVVDHPHGVRLGETGADAVDEPVVGRVT